MGGAVWDLSAVRRRAQQRQVLAEVQGDPAAVASQGAGADPDDLAGRAQLIHPRGGVGARAPRQDVALPHLGGQGEPLQRDEHLAQAVDPGARRRVAVDPLPGRQEAGQLALLGGLDLLAQDGQRGAAQPPQHLGVTPFA